MQASASGTTHRPCTAQRLASSSNRHFSAVRVIGTRRCLQIDLDRKKALRTAMGSTGISGRLVAVEAAAAAPSDSTTSAAPLNGKRAVVVGAGPAGALTAMLLAKQGFKVDVFERLAPLLDERGNVQASIGPRSYNILLNERALSAMDEAGVDVSGFDLPNLELAWRHKQQGGADSGAATRLPGRLMVANRGVLAGALVQQCLAQHADRVQFHFEQELSAIDVNNNCVFFRPVGSAAEGAAMASATAGAGSGCGCTASADADGGLAPVAAAGGVQVAPPEALTQQRTPASPDSLVSFTYDLLVGADGANSVTRTVLQRYDPELQARLTRDSMEYRTCVLGRAADFLPPGQQGAVGTFQTWSNTKKQATIVAGSTKDGLLRAAVVLPGGVHATLKTAADCERFLAETFPSLPPEAIKRGAAELAESPISNGGTITRCTKLNSRSAVLVGDAGHSVYPALGQGANAALQGAAVLATTLRELGTDDMEAVAAEYSRRWLPNALAVADLTEEGFGNNSRSFTLNLKLVQMICQFLLHKLLPFLVPKPAFFEINTGTLPYATLLERTKQELVVFKAVLAAAAAGVLAVLWRNFGRAALTAAGLA